MKNFFLLLLLTVVCFLQFNAACLTDTLYEFRNISSISAKDLTGRKIYTYNNNKQPTEVIQQSWQQVGGVWTNTSRIFYQYHSSGFTSERTEQIWSASTSSWVNKDYRVWIFDSNDNITESIFKSWNTTSNEWENRERRQVVYNVDNKMTEMLNQNWNQSSSTWLNWTKQSSAYDGNGNHTELVLQGWDSTAAVWFLSTKYSYLYNGNNLRVEELTQIWDGAAWKNTNKHVMDYTAAGLLSVDVSYEWQSSSAWLNKTRNTRSYDADNNEIEHLYEVYDYTNLSLVKINKKVRAYNSNNQVTEEVEQDWNTITNAWVNYKKETTNYNALGDMTLYQLRFWNPSLNNWVNSEEVTQTYNTQGDLLSLQVYSGWNVAGSYYSKKYYSEYSCAKIETGVKNILATANLTIYPNPVNLSKITVSAAYAAQYHLYNLLGEELQTGVLHPGKNQIMLEGIPTGIYMFKSGSQSHRLVKQ